MARPGLHQYSAPQGLRWFSHRAPGSAADEYNAPGQRRQGTKAQVPMAQVAEKPSYGSIEDLIAGQPGSIHIECAQEATRRAVDAVRACHAGRRCGFHVATDGGFDRETVGSYLRFFNRLANTGASVERVAERFGLLALRRRRLCKLDREQLALLNFARLELFDPEVCFCERPLDALGPAGRSTVLSWMNERAARGTVFVTAGQPLREALLMPGVACWEDEGR